MLVCGQRAGSGVVAERGMQSRVLRLDVDQSLDTRPEYVPGYVHGLAPVAGIARTPSSVMRMPETRVSKSRRNEYIPKSWTVELRRVCESVAIELQLR